MIKIGFTKPTGDLDERLSQESPAPKNVHEEKKSLIERLKKRANVLKDD